MITILHTISYVNADRATHRDRRGVEFAFLSEAVIHRGLPPFKKIIVGA